MTLKKLPILGVLLTGFPVLGLSLRFANFQPASLVIGQSNFVEVDLERSQTVMDSASVVAVSALGQLAIGSLEGGRVCLWNQVPTNNGVPADIVLGKEGFTSAESGTSASLFGEEIKGVAFTPNGQKLLVSDSSNNRVLIWNSIPTNHFQPADVVIGQMNFFSFEGGVSATKLRMPAGLLITPNGKLLIADSLNHRVLIFNSVPESNGAAADGVMGQVDLMSAVAGSGANQMDQPLGLAMSPEGKLVVSEEQGNRALVFNEVPTFNGMNADVVIGQSGFGVKHSDITQNRFGMMQGVAISSEGELAIGDAEGRVLIYESVPVINSARAKVVLGQTNFTSSGLGDINASALSVPWGLAYDAAGRLFVADPDLSRVTVFEKLPEETVFERDRSDFNGDGLRDILIQTKTGTGSEIHIILMSNDTEVLEDKLIATLTDPRTQVVGAGFYNDDAFLDVLLQSGRTVGYLPMSNMVAKSFILLGVLPKNSGKIRASGDFDFDGFSDVFLQKGSKVQLFHGKNFTPLTDLVRMRPGFKVVGVGDVDADGLIDFLVQKKKNLGLAFFEENLGNDDEEDDFADDLDDEEDNGVDDVGIDEFSVKAAAKKIDKELKVSIVPFRKLNQGLGKVVAVDDAVAGGVNFIFQKKGEVFLLKADEEPMPLSLPGVGVTQKIVGPH
ncbi:MAG: hypothetical protein K1X66_05535 [Verrucomicrobiae bacterium]|nr:hypothetical protein [Verrucomicrobiae bacterium]